MSHQSRRLIKVFIAIVAVSVLMYGPVIRYSNGDDASASKNSPAQQLATLGMKFNGASSCKGSGCHNKSGSDAPPTEVGHEFNIWKDNDKHAGAYTTLTKKDSTDIGTKMKIADVKTSDKCLSCHALNVPAAEQGSNYNIKEGNTCESCHGPSEKWLKDHASADWQTKARAMPHDQLLKTLGIYDTRPLVVRAELCASCHLSIDADMVAAGHPQPSFEMAYYSDIEPKHWDESHFGKITDVNKFVNEKIWMAGQVVCVREAMQQLSDRVKAKASTDAITSAWQQALAHATVFQAAAEVLGIDAAGLKTHADALAGMQPTDGDKLATEADAIVKICEDGKAKVEAFTPDAATSSKLLNAVSSLTGMGTKFGQFGMDQQSMGISSLNEALETGSGKKDDALDKLINDKLFPDNPPKPEDFDKNVAAVKEKLPK